MKNGREKAGDLDLRRAVPSAAARVRAGGEDFASSFRGLKQVVGKACAGSEDWEWKVVAAVQATVRFAAANPDKAMALTVEARRGGPTDQVLAQAVIEYFADRLSMVAPAEARAPVSTDASVVEAIAAIVRGHLLAGAADRLPQVAPDLVYLVLMPYLGIAETRDWAMALSLET